jgi:hypothetical protein
MNAGLLADGKRSLAEMFPTVGRRLSFVEKRARLPIRIGQTKRAGPPGARPPDHFRLSCRQGLFRRQHHQHLAAFKTRERFDLGDLLHVGPAPA